MCIDIQICMGSDYVSNKASLMKTLHGMWCLYFTMFNNKLKYAKGSTFTFEHKNVLLHYCSGNVVGRSQSDDLYQLPPLSDEVLREL